MSIKKALSFLPGLLLAGALVGLYGCAPYASSQPSGKPDSVQILIDAPAPPPGPAQEKSSVTLTDAALTQHLYTTIYTLPELPAQRACTAELGPHYTLTFSQSGKTLVTVLAMRDGCRPVSIAGETQDRQGTAAFWSQLDTAIHAASPPATPDGLAIAQTPDPAQTPQTAQITSAETAQRLYNAILALTWLPQGSACTDTGIPEYQLVFQAADQEIPAIIHNACNSIDLEGAYHTRGGWYSMDDQFKQLFQQTIAGASFAPASPDHLTLSLQTTNASSQTNVTDPQVMQRLYQKVFTLQPTQPQPDCPSGADKIAGTGKWYNLSFSQWGLPILQLDAYEGSCTAVTFSVTQHALQGDQEFWDMLHQAAGQQ
jgi:hypothetical protein